MGAATGVPATPIAHRPLDPYVPRVLLRHLAETPDAVLQTVDATVVFADISGFTKLSERLARLGREGAEELVETIGACFGSLLAVAYENGGSLLKFGGDALLLLFEGEDHVGRGCRSAVGMRGDLRTAGRLTTSAGKVALRMSQGVHSGDFHLFLVGDSHRELLVAGPGATLVVQMEKAADAGEIVVSAGTAARLPAACTGVAKGPGWLLAAAPAGGDAEPWDLPPSPDLGLVAHCLSTEVRTHVLSGPQPAEHRNVTTAFLRFEGTDGLIRREGPAAAANALDTLVSVVQEAVDDQQVCFLESDVDADGGKLMLTAGAPRILGDDEERMLLALRRILDTDLPLEVRIGVNRGSVFSGDVGPAFRRSYSVMGDAVNLAARLMAKAPPGEIYATAGVLDRSATRFALAELEPFAVKGKALPVQAWSVGPPLGRRAREGVAVRFPLVGRERELGMLADALAAARSGRGWLVDIAGEPGIGKTRLMEDLRGRAPDLRRLHVTCEPYTASTPYAVWRELLRPLVGIGSDDAEDLARERLRSYVERVDPGLLAWLPLLGIPLGLSLPPTREVEELAEEFRRGKLHEVVLHFLASGLSTPTLIEIDDAHLMDGASADLLHAMSEVLERVPWLVVVTRRDGGSAFVPPDSPAVLRVWPSPLGSHEALALAEAVTDDAPLAPHVLELACERSAGNPQFLRDLLREAAVDGGASLPESIEAAAMARIDRLQPGDRAIVRRAAVLGLSFASRFLEDVLAGDVTPPDEQAWRRLDGLFVAEGEGHMRFRRAVMREAAYAGVPFRTRRRLHAVVGAHLEADAGDSPDDLAPILSLHFLRAGDHAKAWRYARMAGDGARNRFAYVDAAAHYRRSIDAARGLKVAPGDLAAVWEALGEARAHTGDLAGAMEAFTAARGLVQDDPVREAHLLHRHALVSLDAGRVRPTVRWVMRALRVLEGVDGMPAAACRAHLVSTLATVRQRQGRMADAIRLCHRAIGEAEAAGNDTALAHSCYILDWALVASGRAAEATHSARALEIYTRLGDLDRQAAIYNNLGGFAYFEGRWADAVALYLQGAEASIRAGDAANAAFGDCNVGEVLADQGHLADAEGRLRRALRVWRATGYEWGVAFSTALLGRVAMRDGRDAEALRLLEDALTRFRTLRVEGDAAFVEALLAEAWAFGGHAELALDTVDRLREEAPGGGQAEALLDRVRAFAFAQQGDLGAAVAALQSSIAAARARGDDYELAVGLDVMEALARSAGAGDAARRRERDAILARLDVVALPPAPVGA